MVGGWNALLFVPSFIPIVLNEESFSSFCLVSSFVLSVRWGSIKLCPIGNVECHCSSIFAWGISLYFWEKGCSTLES